MRMVSAHNKKASFPKRVVTVLIGVALLLFLIHLVLKYVSIVMFDQQHGFLFELSNRFDVNDENSVPQWFSQILFLFIGSSALLASYLQTDKSSKRFWLSIGVIGFLLSLDDVATLHEFSLQMIHNTYFLGSEPSFFTNAWWLLMPVVLCVAALLSLWAWRVLPRRTVLLLVLGGSVYIFGKILMDSVANDVADLFLESGIVQGVEKIFQYSGSSIVLYAILDYLSDHHSEVIQKAISQLKH
jgi:hypothetical protein